MTRLNRDYETVTKSVTATIIEFDDHDEYFMECPETVDECFRIDYKETFTYVEEMKKYYVDLFEEFAVKSIPHYDIPCIWWIKKDGPEEFILLSELPEKHQQGINRAFESEDGMYIEPVRA